MMTDPVLADVFQRVHKRLVEHSDSLCLFKKHWIGSSAGIEGWFKVEFVAALSRDDAPKVLTGGAAGKGLAGKKKRYPDLTLDFRNGTTIHIETKAGVSIWWYGGSKSYIEQRYGGWVIAFLAFSTDPLPTKQRVRLESIDPNVQVELVCAVQMDKGPHAHYFGMIDLRSYATTSAAVDAR